MTEFPESSGFLEDEEGVGGLQSKFRLHAAAAHRRRSAASTLCPDLEPSYWSAANRGSRARSLRDLGMRSLTFGLCAVGLALCWAASHCGWPFSHASCSEHACPPPVEDDVKAASAAEEPVVESVVLPSTVSPPRQLVESVAEDLAAWELYQNQTLTRFIQGDRDAVLIFAHLHKTGGTSLEETFASEYGSDFLIPDSPGTPDEDERMRHFILRDGMEMKIIRDELLQWRVFGKHIAFGFHALLWPRQSIYMTMLRRPKDRLLSLYGYYQHHKGGEYWPSDLPRNASFAAFVAHGAENTCGCRFHDEYLGLSRHLCIYQPTCIDNYATRMLCGYYSLLNPGPTDASTYLCAKANLEHYFVFVGVMERFNESQCVLSKILQWSTEPPVRHSNSYEHPSVTSANLTDITRWDSLLYCYANQRLDLALRRFPECKDGSAPVDYTSTWCSHTLEGIWSADNNLDP